MRIAFTGTSGTGKSTLAKALAERLSLPLLSEDHQEILRAVSLLQTARSQGREVEHELNGCRKALLGWLDQRESDQEEKAAFVADRFSVDIAAAWLSFDLSQGDDDDAAKLIARCRRQAILFDAIIAPSPQGVSYTLQNEGGITRQVSLTRRIMSHSLLLGLSLQWAKGKLIVIPEAVTVLEERLHFVSGQLGLSSGEQLN